MNAILTADPIESDSRADAATVVEKMRNAERSSGGEAEEPCQHVGKSWDCQRVENELEKRDATDWLMDEEMMRQWKEISKICGPQRDNHCKSGKAIAK